MIGQHPDLAGLPELKLFCCPTLGELEASLPRYWMERGLRHRSPGLVRALAEYLFGGQTEQSLSAARAWLQDRPDWSGSDVLDVLLERLSPRTAVEKSPDNLLTDAALARMAAAYPRARYLHLTRHPVTTQRSIQEYRDRSVPSHPPDGEPMAGIGSWYAIHRRILLFACDLPEQHYLRVRAEDVLNDGRSQLQKIAAWLGIGAEDGAIEAMLHPETSPFARPGPPESGVAGGNDPSFLRDPIPRRAEIPCKLEPPPGWVADPPVWEMVADLANRLGYFDCSPAQNLLPGAGAK
jgi:Sulfotransferase family